MPSADDVYLEALRRMSSARKLAVMEGLRHTAWELKAAWIRREEPTLSDDEVQERVRQIFLHAGS